MSETPTPQMKWEADSAFDAMLTERDKKIEALEADNQWLLKTLRILQLCKLRPDVQSIIDKALKEKS